MTTRKQQQDVFVDALMYNLSAPVITASGKQDADLIETHRSNITLHRLADNIKLDLFNKKECTDYEAMLYLSTLSLVAPISHDAYKVYMYLGRKYLPAMANVTKDLFHDIRSTELEPTEQQTLTELKRKIFKDQMKAMKT